MQLKEGTCHTCKYCNWNTIWETHNGYPEDDHFMGRCFYLDTIPLPPTGAHADGVMVEAETPHENCPCYKRREG